MSVGDGVAWVVVTITITLMIITITLMIITITSMIITITTMVITITSMIITSLSQVRVMEQRLGEVDWSPSERSARAEELQREAAEKERVIRRWLFAGGDDYLAMGVIIWWWW